MTTDTDTVRIVVDGSKCDGRGICALILPERISLDRWGYASIDDEPIEKQRTLARARRAVAACPAKALSLKGAQRRGRSSGDPIAETTTWRDLQSRPGAI